MGIGSQAVLLGAWFGLLHAFDAGHLATIGGLAVRERSLAPAAYALRWAFGHAAAIGLVAAAVLGFGATGALDLSRYAELAVCAALFAIGAQAIGAGRRFANTPSGEREPAATTRERRLRCLTRWQPHARGGRTSVVLGLLHGGAGSAAVLTVLPLTRFDSGTAAAIYLACFSLGVALGALAFARVFQVLARRSATAGTWLAVPFRASVGIVAITSGAQLLYGVLHGGG